MFGPSLIEMYPLTLENKKGQNQTFLTHYVVLPILYMIPKVYV